MGTWGTGISSNDAFADVYGEFFDLYNDGNDPGEISRRLIKENWEMIEIPEDNHNFWFALALAQWECKQLEPDVFETVVSIVETGKDIDLWRELGANDKDLHKRNDVLRKFLEKLRSERPKARARKKQKIWQPAFEKGSCLTFKLANGNYGGAVVIEAVSGKGYAYNLVAVTRINTKKSPGPDNFAKTDVLVINFANWKNKAAVYWMSPQHFQDDKDLFEVVGSIDVKRQFDKKSSEFGFCGGWKIWIIDMVDSQFEHEKRQGVMRNRLRLTDFLKKPWWRA